MKHVKLHLLNQEIEILSDDPEKVAVLAQKINNIIAKLRIENKNANAIQLALLSNLILQDRVEELENDMQNATLNSGAKFKKVQKQTVGGEAIQNHVTSDEMTSLLDYMLNYIQSTTSKIKKYKEKEVEI